MSNRNDRGNSPIPTCSVWLKWFASSLAVLVPVAAAASTKLITESGPVPRVERTAPARTPSDASTKGSYRVRCWQHGRLLFEETHVTLPTDGSRFTLKLTGYDGNGRPMYVAETINATCLVRHDRTLLNLALPR